MELKKKTGKMWSSDFFSFMIGLEDSAWFFNKHEAT